MASPNLSEIVTTTLRNRTGKLADNVTENIALLKKMRTRGTVKPADGGRTIVQELNYAENVTFQWYSGYEVLNISPSDVMTAAEFDWKQAAVNVVISGLEQMQNSGSERIIDLLESRITNAEQTMMNQISTGIYSNGTAAGGKQIGGLQLLVADDPTSGTVGGINRLNWNFWRNQTFNTTSEIGSAASAANIQRCMNELYLRCSRNNDRPDFIVADNEYFQFYWNSLQAIQRISQTDTGEAGYQNLKFMGADVVFDGGYGGSCPANHMYFLNTKYIHFRPHPQRNFAPGDAKESINQDAIVRPILFMGNMTLSNAFLQGVLWQS